MTRVAVIGIGSIGSATTGPLRTLGALAGRRTEDAGISAKQLGCAYAGYAITGLLTVRKE